MMSKYYFYQFEDGYHCWYAGKLTKSEICKASKTHGQIVRIESKNF